MCKGWGRSNAYHISLPLCLTLTKDQLLALTPLHNSHITTPLELSLVWSVHSIPRVNSHVPSVPKTQMGYFGKALCNAVRIKRLNSLVATNKNLTMSRKRGDYTHTQETQPMI